MTRIPHLCVADPWVPAAMGLRRPGVGRLSRPVPEPGSASLEAPPTGLVAWAARRRSRSRRRPPRSARPDRPHPCRGRMAGDAYVRWSAGPIRLTSSAWLPLCRASPLRQSGRHVLGMHARRRSARAGAGLRRRQCRHGFHGGVARHCARAPDEDARVSAGVWIGVAVLGGVGALARSGPSSRPSRLRPFRPRGARWDAGPQGRPNSRSARPRSANGPRGSAHRCRRGGIRF